MVTPDPSTQASDPSMDKNAIVKDQPKPSLPMAPENVRNGGGGDRNALKVPVMEDGLRGWSYGLYDCFADRKTCALACCCSCYVYSRNKRRLEHLETHGTPLREPVERCNRDCKLYCVFGQSAQSLQAISRNYTRRRYGIRGDVYDDVRATGNCLSCALVQEHREILLEESSFTSCPYICFIIFCVTNSTRGTVRIMDFDWSFVVLGPKFDSWHWEEG